MWLDFKLKKLFLNFQNKNFIRKMIIVGISKLNFQYRYLVKEITYYEKVHLFIYLDQICI